MKIDHLVWIERTIQLIEEEIKAFEKSNTNGEYDYEIKDAKFRLEQTKKVKYLMERKDE